MSHVTFFRIISHLQGNDPSTDLRGVGLLGILQPLFLLTTPDLAGLARDVYKISQSDTQEFPFMVLSINLTRIAYDALMDGLLNGSENHFIRFRLNGGLERYL